jgi:hypothetical protein
MWRWVPGLSALVATAAAVVLVELAPWPPVSRGDFAPFVMTIEEWNADRGRTADGRSIEGTYVYRVGYHDRANWTRTLIADNAPGAQIVLVPQQGNGCRNGVYGQIDVSGTFHATSADPLMCTSLDRWIHYGLAWSYLWKREICDGTITYTDPGERVMFDATTGLPLLYEAGLTTGAAKYRVTYRLDSWGR